MFTATDTVAITYGTGLSKCIPPSKSPSRHHELFPTVVIDPSTAIPIPDVQEPLSTCTQRSCNIGAPSFSSPPTAPSPQPSSTMAFTSTQTADLNAAIHSFAPTQDQLSAWPAAAQLLATIVSLCEDSLGGQGLPPLNGRYFHEAGCLQLMEHHPGIYAMIHQAHASGDYAPIYTLGSSFRLLPSGVAHRPCYIDVLRDQHYVNERGREHAAAAPYLSPFNQAVSSAAQRDASMPISSFPMLYGLTEHFVADPQFAPLAAAANQHVQSAADERLDQDVLAHLRAMQRGRGSAL